MPAQHFEYVRGRPARYDSSDFAHREFCPRCGTQLAFRDHRLPDKIDITSASLDKPELAPPADHIWTRSRIAWFDTADDLPRHRQARTPDND